MKQLSYPEAYSCCVPNVSRYISTSYNNNMVSYSSVARTIPRGDIIFSLSLPEGGYYTIISPVVY